MRSQPWPSPDRVCVCGDSFVFPRHLRLLLVFFVPSTGAWHRRTETAPRFGFCFCFVVFFWSLFRGRLTLSLHSRINYIISHPTYSTVVTGENETKYGSRKYINTNIIENHGVQEKCSFGEFPKKVELLSLSKFSWSYKNHFGFLHCSWRFITTGCKCVLKYKQYRILNFFRKNLIFRWQQIFVRSILLSWMIFYKYFRNLLVYVSRYSVF